MTTGDPLNNSVATYVMQDSHSDQKTTIAGLRWDVARNVALKAQWDGIRGEAAFDFPLPQGQSCGLGRQHGCLLAGLGLRVLTDAFPSLPPPSCDELPC
jgi:hypothetical protein